MPIFRSALQARLLLLVLTSDSPLTAADLARALGAPEPTVSREVRRLLDAGLLSGERIGRSVVLGPAHRNPATAPLRQLLVVTYGPSHALEQALSVVDGIDSAYVYGSWAARYHGEPGGPPGDIDVLIVGHAERGAVDAVLNDLESLLGREVDTTYLSPERWRTDDSPFVANVRSSPLVELHLDRRTEAVP